MKIITAKNYKDMSHLVANIIIQRIRDHSELTLGLATGGTPIETYKYLIEDHQQNNTSYQNVCTFNLDEYIGIEPTDHNSYHFYMQSNLFDHIDIPTRQTHIPNGKAKGIIAECEAYEAKIQSKDGIDLQLLGIGTNGHIGFNEPGTSFDTSTQVVQLADATRQANARYFKSVEKVPKKAITMGIGTIMKSKEILLLVSGKNKRKALERLINGEIDPIFPASILNHHPSVTVVADHDALQNTVVPSSILL
ncbi:glucosamine-6-phosphate deaminase [Salipaludibacillus sp. HK11]|uniref:glucosamine-6-phosphate deaminase n=1 Tax=Salipaludibacillus sp. HK11 TaxID=3394320 RepID=UPI0039FC79C4